MAQDKQIKCKDCGQTFTFPKKDQEFFQEKGFTDPVRCKPCRTERKQRMGDR